MTHKVLYIGGFELPDKNAAAQRVLSIAKALRDAKYEVLFYGITKSEDFKGEVCGFSYEAYPYPASTRDWIRYAVGIDIISYIKKINPNYIITYNYPAVAQERIIRFCRKRGIKVIGDITEWYASSNFVKRVDITLRMRWSNKHLDGIIAISKYLHNYYSQKKVLLLPPLVDSHEEKWGKKCNESNSNAIRLIYVGSPGGGKDRLDYILKGISKVDSQKFILDIVGITEKQYSEIYGIDNKNCNVSINFHGRIPHIQAVELLKKSDFQIFFRDYTRVNNAGFPTKLVESISAGIPVIVNDISNISDYIVDGFNGFIISIPSEEAILKVLHKVALLSNDDIKILKLNINQNTFDYRNYVSSIVLFMNNL